MYSWLPARAAGVAAPAAAPVVVPVVVAAGGLAAASSPAVVVPVPAAAVFVPVMAGLYTLHLYAFGFLGAVLGGRALGLAWAARGRGIRALAPVAAVAAAGRIWRRPAAHSPPSWIRRCCICAVQLRQSRITRYS